MRMVSRHIPLIAAALTTIVSAAGTLPPEPDRVPRLPPIEIQAKGISDFGMSIATNTQAGEGGPIRWMLVGDVAPDSAAAKAGLRSGDRILRVDGVDATKLSVRAMLETFFERDVGDRLTLLIADRGNGKQRTVDLECLDPDRSAQEG